MAAAASAFQPFSIRAYAARMRAVDAAKCWPFGGGEEAAARPLLPPMALPPRSRWWAHELAAERARLEESAKGVEAAGCGDGVGLPKERKRKRKGPCRNGVAERARKRRRMLQIRFFSKHKEKTFKPQSTSHLLQHVLHTRLLRKCKNSTILTRKELAARKKLQKTWDHMSTHHNSLNKQSKIGSNSSDDMNSCLFRSKEANSFVKGPTMKANESGNFLLNPGHEVVKHVTYPPKDDIFGDLPLLESSKIMFQSEVDELPTVIEDSFIANHSGPDAIQENVPLKLIPASESMTRISSPLVNLVQNDGTPDTELTCMSHGDVATNMLNNPSSVRFNGPLDQRRINMVKSSFCDMQMKSIEVSALSSYSEEGPKSGSSNPPQECFCMMTNCCQESNKPVTSWSGTCSAALKTRTEATKTDRNSPDNGKKSTDTSSPMVRTEYHVSSEGSGISSSARSQGTDNRIANAENTPSCKHMPAKEYIPTLPPNSQDRIVKSNLGGIGDAYHARAVKHCCTEKDSGCSFPASSPFGNFQSSKWNENSKSVDPCASGLVEDKGSWYSKLHPVCTPASIGLAFMKLPGLERMEITSCNLRTNINRSVNGRSMKVMRSQKEQLMGSVTNSMQDQAKIAASNSLVGKTSLNGYVRQDVHYTHQPTVRLMGKTVSVFKCSKEHSGLTMGKVLTDNIISQDYHPSPISCQFPQKKLFTCQDSVLSRGHGNESLEFLSGMPNNYASEARVNSIDLHTQRLQQMSCVSSSAKDCIRCAGSQFLPQPELNKASIATANSNTRCPELHPLSHVVTVPQNQFSVFCSPAPHVCREDSNFVVPAANRSSPSFPQWVLNASMQEKYQKSTLFSCEDPSLIPIVQPCQAPGTKFSSTLIMSFVDYGPNNSQLRNSSLGLHPSPTTSLAGKSMPTIRPTCGSLTNITGRKGAGCADQRNKRVVCADNVSQQPAKKTPVTDKQAVTMPVVSNFKNHSFGWSLNDALGPQTLDFRNK